METLFWFLEYAKVGIAYFFIMFIWPMVIFRKFLKGKSRTFKFGFCTGTQMILINTVILLMGWIKILNPLTIKVLFWGTFFVSSFWNFRPTKKNITRAKNFFAGTYGTKSLVSDAWHLFLNWIGTGIENFKKFIEGRKLEFGLLFVILMYAVIYFSYGAFQDTSFGTGDLYTHNQWIYELCNGNIFSAGVYPEGMHCFIAIQHMAFGIDIFSCVLFTAGIHTFVIFMAMYIFFKNLFTWKYSAHILLVIYLTLNVIQLDAIFSFCRYQWTLPQEFGYPAMFVLLTYLVKFLKGKFEKGSIKWYQFWKNEDLFMFSSALAATFAIHFYITIMAFFVCVAIAVPFVKQLFSRKFLPLVVSAIVGIVIAVVPMVAAVATGTRLQGSLYWAMSLMDSGDTDDTAGEGDKNGTTVNNSAATNGNSSAVSGGNTNNTTASGSQLDNNAETNVGTNVAVAKKSLGEKITGAISTFYSRGYVLPFGQDRGLLVLFVVAISCIVWIFATALRIYWRKNDKYKYAHSAWYNGYAIMILMALVYQFLLTCRALGLPAIIDETRLYPFHHLFCYALFIVPCDFIVSMIVDRFDEVVFNIIGVVAIVLTFVVIKATGFYHGYLMCQLTRYNSAVTVTKSIVDQMKPQSYTIVSTTDEIYQSIGHGYHEELISFVNQAEIVSYTLPTEYVYVYVEKNPLKRNQYNFYSGPSWLAEERYYELFGPGYASDGKKITKGTINEDMAYIFFGPFPYSADIYATQWKRTALMAKAYVWCQKFNQMYPNELHVFYEDDDFVCYYFKQNPRNLYELAVMDSDAMLMPEEYPNPFWPAGATAVN